MLWHRLYGTRWLWLFPRMVLLNFPRILETQRTLGLTWRRILSSTKLLLIIQPYPKLVYLLGLNMKSTFLHFILFFPIWPHKKTLLWPSTLPQVYILFYSISYSIFFICSCIGLFQNPLLCHPRNCLTACQSLGKYAFMNEVDHDVYEELLAPLLKDSPIKTNVVEDDNSNPNAHVQKKSWIDLDCE